MRGVAPPSAAGPLQYAVVVAVGAAAAFAIAVVQDHALRGEAGHRPVLAVEIEHQNVIGARALREIVEPGDGVLLEAAEQREVVLPAIAVACAEQTRAQCLIDIEQTAKIRGERLHAHAHAVEVIAIGDDAQTFLAEQLLHADELIVERAARIGEAGAARPIAHGAVDARNR